MKYLKKAGYFVALLVFLFLVLGPFIWTFVISITPEYAMFAKTTEPVSYTHLFLFIFFAHESTSCFEKSL